MSVVELVEELAPQGAKALYGPQAERLILERIQNTLSSNVAGLISPTNLAAIVESSAAFRPIVASAKQVPLTSGKLTYPAVTSRPAAAKQTAEKTEAGGTKLAATMAEAPAETYGAGGDLSWQAAKYATPELIELWMTLGAQSYAKATEAAAAAALVAGVTATGTVAGNSLAQWMTAITTAAATIQSGDFLADTVWADPVTAGKLGALVYGVSPGASTVAGLRLVSSNGLTPSGPVAVVGYSQALYCAETPGAPIQLRAAEPAIGGVEVGVIGSFAAAVADPAAFVKLTPP